MQQIQILELLAGSIEHNAFLRREFPLPGGKHKAGASVVASRIDDIEIDAKGGKPPRLHHTQIVGRPLVGPAALPVVWLLVLESHIEHIFQIGGNSERRLKPYANLQDGIVNFSGRWSRSDPEYKILIIPFPVILNQQRKIAFNRDNPSIASELEGTDVPVEDAAFFVHLRQLQLFTVNYNVTRLPKRHVHSQSKR
ncbi:hypothetical protein FYJ85_01685 [Victivallaceae bacterium BBE-744-WT-12]|uniref:Uncharacterized protein n=1 Tax=Victivallis lenta TaxID=2606640 RepID=A0A844FZH2_9BACT|nr:hypothetical protein [Victivallis lenta]MST95758.1 hypothetical protein [Victivallis lenta]